MGCCSSHLDGDKPMNNSSNNNNNVTNDSAISRDGPVVSEINGSLVDKMLQDPDAEAIGTAKVLILGCSEAGKSSVYNQLRFLYGKREEYEKELWAEYKERIYSYIIVNVRKVLEYMQSMDRFEGPNAEAMKEFLEMKFEPEEEDLELDAVRHEEDSIVNVTGNTTTDPEEVNFEIESMKESFEKVDVKAWDLLRSFWEDIEFRRSAHEVHIYEPLRHFVVDLERLQQDDYNPSREDVLHLYTPTTGIHEEFYVVENVRYEIVDVGGKASERRKWVHFFENVQCVCFVAALDEYDRMDNDGSHVNRFDEALKVFKEIAETEALKDAELFLLLNKMDLFKLKLHKIPFRQDHSPPSPPSPATDHGEDEPETNNPVPGSRFTDFEGPAEVNEEFYQAAKKYIENLFTKDIKREKPPQVIAMSAMETSEVQAAFSDCRHLITTTFFPSVKFDSTVKMQ